MLLIPHPQLMALMVAVVVCAPAVWVVATAVARGLLRA
jgi:hypothetical protein